ncbi:MAG: zinc metalloprotease HtpX [Candidatus Micrarchaeia archaeon]
MFSGITKLQLTMIFTTVLVFGVVGGILAVLLLYMGVSGYAGILIWLIFSLFMIGLQWYLGPIIIVWVTGAKELGENQLPWLHRMVEDLSKEANIPKPKLYVVEDSSPNAFAFGRTQGSSAIAVHTGLLRMLDEDEVRAVVAHEIGHIKHRDVLVMTVASVLPVLLYYMVIIFGGSRDRERSAGSYILVFLGAIIAQFLGQLLVMWLSRVREYYADAFSAYATKQPVSLMRALAKITYRHALSPSSSSSPVNAFYIADPSSGSAHIAAMARALELGNDELLSEAIEKEKKMGAIELFSTHPLTANRLEALMKIKKEIGA